MCWKIVGLLFRDMLLFYLLYVCLSKRSFDVINCVVFFFCRVCRDVVEYYRYKVWFSVYRNFLLFVLKLYLIYFVFKGGGSCYYCVFVGVFGGLY